MESIASISLSNEENAMVGVSNLGKENSAPGAGGILKELVGVLPFEEGREGTTPSGDGEPEQKNCSDERMSSPSFWASSGNKRIQISEPSSNLEEVAEEPYEDSKQQIECIVCTELLAGENSRSLACMKGHKCCSDCAIRYVLEMWASSDLPCPPLALINCCHHECDQEYNRLEVISVIANHPAALKCFIGRMTEYERQKSVQEITQKLSSETQEHKETILLQASLSGLMRDPRMCPECKFGPVENTKCDNLSHNNGAFARLRLTTSRTTPSVYNNHCPSCGFFAVSFSSWLRWDGEVRFVDRGTPANPQFLYRSLPPRVPLRPPPHTGGLALPNLYQQMRDRPRAITRAAAEPGAYALQMEAIRLKEQQENERFSVVDGQICFRTGCTIDQARNARRRIEIQLRARFDPDSNALGVVNGGLAGLVDASCEWIRLKREQDEVMNKEKLSLFDRARTHLILEACIQTGCTREMAQRAHESVKTNASVLQFEVYPLSVSPAVKQLAERAICQVARTFQGRHISTMPTDPDRNPHQGRWTAPTPPYIAYPTFQDLPPYPYPTFQDPLPYPIPSYTASSEAAASVETDTTLMPSSRPGLGYQPSLFRTRRFSENLFPSYFPDDFLSFTQNTGLVPRQHDEEDDPLAAISTTAAGALPELLSTAAAAAEGEQL